MMERSNIADGQKIQNSIRRKMWWPLAGLLIMGLVIFTAAFIYDFSNRRYETSCIHMPVSADSFYDTLVAFSTILAAAVIFYYSVQDKTTEGIPNRTILVYTFGSYTIPVYFIISMLLLPLNYMLSHLKMELTVGVCTVFTYIVQMVVIILILFSNFYAFSLTAICNAEIRQYKKMCELAPNDDVVPENSPHYIWTYLIHHSELSMQSDELLTDKISLIRRLLGTPFYEKEFCGWNRKHFYIWKNPNDYVMQMSSKCMEENSLRKIYEFYYGNLSAVMAHLNKSEHIIIRNKVYMVLYEFLKNLHNLYQTATTPNNAEPKYLMTVSGIMNAILEYSTEDSEAFCIHILNNCITDETLRSRQIVLYFFLQEYLYRTSSQNGLNNIHLEHLNEIQGIKNLDLTFKDEELFFSFWIKWMEWTNLSHAASLKYFYNAVLTLKGEKHNSAPLAYIRLSIQQIKENDE